MWTFRHCCRSLEKKHINKRVLTNNHTYNLVVKRSARYALWTLFAVSFQCIISQCLTILQTGLFSFGFVLKRPFFNFYDKTTDVFQLYTMFFLKTNRRVFTNYMFMLLFLLLFQTCEAFDKRQPMNKIRNWKIGSFNWFARNLRFSILTYQWMTDVPACHSLLQFFATVALLQLISLCTVCMYRVQYVPPARAHIWTCYGWWFVYL